jgi:hypothetical protein
MSLVYNGSCPTLYQPPGFIDRDNFQEWDARLLCESLAIDGGNVVGALETNRHQVRVALRLSDREAHPPSTDSDDKGLSEQLQAMQETSSSQGNNLLSTLIESTPMRKRGPAGTLPGSKRVKTCTPQTRLGITSALPQGLSKISLRKESTAVKEEKVSLEPQELSIEFAETPMSTSDEQRPHLDSTKLAELLIHCYTVQRKETCVADQAVFDNSLLGEGTIKRLTRSGNVNCECGSQHRSSRMVSSYH